MMRTSSMFYSLDERHGRAKSANATGTTVDRQNGMQTSSDSTFIGTNDANFGRHTLACLARRHCTAAMHAPSCGVITFANGVM